WGRFAGVEAGRQRVRQGRFRFRFFPVFSCVRRRASDPNSLAEGWIRLARMIRTYSAQETRGNVSNSPARGTRPGPAFPPEPPPDLARGQDATWEGGISCAPWAPQPYPRKGLTPRLAEKGPRRCSRLDLLSRNDYDAVPSGLLFR